MEKGTEHKVIKGTEYKLCQTRREFKIFSRDYFYNSKRSTDGLANACIECKKASNKKSEKKNKENKKAYREQNKEKFKRYFHNRYINNKEENKQIYKEYYQKNKEAIKERTKKYLQENKDKIEEYLARTHINRLDKKAIYRKNNKDNIKKYYDEHKEYYKNYILKRKSLKRGLISIYSEDDWENCKNHFNNKCAYCGADNKLSQDHFIALTRRGEYTKNNIVPACYRCNSSKGNRDFFYWYPQQQFYNKKRERTIMEYLNYDNKTQYQQIGILI
jgi:5-methylcytosine-specific restriction endonuclease McrA